MSFHCILAGVGGQGTVLASKLIAAAAMEQQLFVRCAETIGMAQRGGCVVSHVRAGKTVHSPLIPKGEADVIIGFEPGEAVRALPYLKKDGSVIVADRAITPITGSLDTSNYQASDMLAFLKQHTAHLTVLDTARILTKVGSAKVLNVALLGAVAQLGILGVTLAEMEDILTRMTPSRFLETNRQALAAGAEGVLKA